MDISRRPPPMSPYQVNFKFSTTNPPKSIPTNPTPTTRTCVSCRSPLPATLVFKSCDKCREKSRRHAANSLKRRRERLAMMKTLESDDHDPRTRLVDNTDSEDGGGGLITAEGWDQMTKRLKIEFNNAKAKGKAPQKFESKKRPRPTSPGPSSDAPTECQSSAQLFSVLSAQPKDKPLVFSAAYSIVSSASPPVTLKRRVELVIRDLYMELKKSERVTFNRLTPTATSTGALSSSQTFACLCSHGTSTTTTSLTSTSPAPKLDDATNSSASTSSLKQLKFKHSQSHLSRYFSGFTGDSKLAGGAGSVGGTRCGGVIKVTVEDDWSHSLRIKAHRVLVSVQH